MEERYINPHTDFGFKRLFGSEFNKELLVSFLNALFVGKEEIKELTYMKSEQFGKRREVRCAFFDVYCENDKGKKFIVEIQNVYSEFFKDRTIYYSTLPIHKQARTEGCDFHLNGGYVIGFLNFNIGNESKNTHNVQHEVKLMNVDTNEVSYNKFTYFCVETPKFNKTENELVTMYDKWMYVLKNLSRLMERPAALQERIFTQLFEQAEIAKFNIQELKAYEESMSAYRDIVNAINTARKIKFAEGMEKGMEKRNMEIARNMLEDGEPTDKIIRYTGLTLKDIESLIIQ